MKVIQVNGYIHIFVAHIETIEVPIGTNNYKSSIRTHSGRVLHSDRTVAELLEEINGQD